MMAGMTMTRMRMVMARMRMVMAGVIMMIARMKMVGMMTVGMTMARVARITLTRSCNMKKAMRKVNLALKTFTYEICNFSHEVTTCRSRT